PRHTARSGTPTRCSTSSSWWRAKRGCRSASNPRSAKRGSGRTWRGCWSPGTRGVDFITIDGGEGGTRAGPLVFSDHVALPFKVGFSRVQKIFTERGVHQQIVFVGSGKLGFPEAAVFAFALGCDTINVAREAMLSIGCIQAQRCHTNHCPTGVATQHPWLVRGIDPTLKAARLANYIVTLRK